MYAKAYGGQARRQGNDFKAKARHPEWPRQGRQGARLNEGKQARQVLWAVELRRQGRATNVKAVALCQGCKVWACTMVKAISNLKAQIITGKVTGRRAASRAGLSGLDKANKATARRQGKYDDAEIPNERRAARTVAGHSSVTVRYGLRSVRLRTLQGIRQANKAALKAKEGRHEGPRPL